MKNITFQLLSVGLAIGVAAGCNSSSSDNTSATTSAGSTAKGDAKPVEVAFVTNNASDYWKSAEAGTKAAAKDIPGVTVDYKLGDNTAAGQKTIIDDMISKGVQGIAISPMDPKNQTPLLNDIAKKGIVVVTQDSDAPQSDRVMYIGTDNLAAGKMLGEAVKKVLPNGGKIEVFVGQADVQNAKDRYEGMKEALAGTKCEIVGELQDDTDRVRAKSNVSDTLVKVPDIACLVGLWSYNGGAIYSAVKDAGKIGKVKIVCFDSEQPTIDGIRQGGIDATVVQQPYKFGYDAVKVMAAYIRGDKSLVPASKTEYVPTEIVDKSNLDKFLSDNK